MIIEENNPIYMNEDDDDDIYEFVENYETRDECGEYFDSKRRTHSRDSLRIAHKI